MTRSVLDTTSIGQLSSNPQEAVYLLHGFAGRPWWMHRLASFLRCRNYAVRNWGYSSIRKTIADHAAALRSELDRTIAEGAFRRLHFVTYSLGGIIVRQVLCEYRPSIPGRMVMLAPPNMGSKIARACSGVLGGLCPILKELSTRHDSYVNRLGAPGEVEIGIIAASNDWTVSVNNTYLKTQTDHIIIRGDHLRLPLMRASAEQTVHFLAKGTFRRSMAA